MITKSCTKCHIEKELIFFDKSKSGKHGVRGNCKGCKKRYRCRDCTNLIDYTTFYYGKGRCKSCANVGILNPNYKSGKSTCVDCNNLTSSANSLRCISCYKNFNMGHSFKNTKSLISCKICNKNFHKYKSEIKNNNFCNNQCRGIWVSKTRSGSNHHYYGITGKAHPSYVHGNGHFPYNKEFNKKLKLIIRKRDNFECQRCEIKEKNHFRGIKQINLTIHHMDYNKMNCVELNLITLCHKCNVIANFNRDYWFAYYTYLMENFNDNY